MGDVKGRMFTVTHQEAALMAISDVYDCPVCVFLYATFWDGRNFANDFAIKVGILQILIFQ